MKPTLKQLVEKATPGPWKVRELADEFFLRTNHKHSVDSPLQIVAKTEGMGEMYAANAQLIARCSPSVMLAVVEALERITDQLERVGDSRKDAPFIEEARDALNLLNGKSP